MQTIAETLGAYAATLKYEDIPREVIHQAKRTITDTLGCAFGGYDSDPAKIARDLAGLVSGSRPATLLCEIDVILRSGERKSIRAEYHRSHWRNPMTDTEIETKFRSLAEGMLPVGRVDALLDQL